MKPLIITSLIALTAPQAAAGGWHFNFGIKDGKTRVGIEYRKHHRDRDYERTARRHRRTHEPVERCHRDWVEGRYETETYRVWVRGARRRVWHPAKYGFRYDRHGHHVRFVVRAGHYDFVESPGHYETRSRRTWNPGHYEYHCTVRGHRHGRRHGR